MTVVQPNSIAGINSITVQSGESLSIHKSDGCLLREIVSATGVGTFYAISVGTAGTISNTGNAALAGIVTANGGVKVGAAATIYANGNATFSGIGTFAHAALTGTSESAIFTQAATAGGTTDIEFETADNDIIDFTESNPFGTVGSSTDLTI